ncbi:hypothetical protein JAO78_003115 [Alishewanella sp. 16-MA]|uniref:Uncharacterized protein n=1 Tax=Alishewanella maricola TaxID=2795740 RepID=A0ABS8C0F5_9ALTE|nr:MULTISPECIES: hypothetical protein [Gammaproteobacteria]MDP4945171.1 hypothetical protein [Alishewanella sp.]MDP5206043.1 hypothetical protein [Alishewanella sp. SMS9]MCB5225801.1 hypothetical protein [Alishewanella maricola]MCC5451009.1 hypothetical protein [Rheinheimera sp. UJ51]MCF4007924.1 hypothetical protein [Rheinheimera sp. UJ63]
MSINASNNINPSSLLNPATNRPQPSRTVQPERESVVKETAGIRFERDAVERLDSEREAQTNRQSFRDNTEQRNERAVAAYQSLQNEQRRSEVQAMLGVDLYA